MKEIAHDVFQYIPFIGLVAGKMTSPLITRLAEAAIFGAITMWGTTQVLGERVDSVKNQLAEVRQEQKLMQNTITDVRVILARVDRDK